MAALTENDIKDLRTELRNVEAKRAEAREAADKLVADIRASGVNPVTDADAFAKIDEAYKASDALGEEAGELRSRLERGLSIVADKATERRDSTERREARDIATRFLESDSYRRLRESGALEMKSARVDTLPVEVMKRDELLTGLRQRATVDNTDPGGGGLIWSDRKDFVIPLAERRVRLLDIVTVGTTDSDTVEWAKEQTRTHAAAETDYGTAAPEATYEWTKDSTTVKRIPHFVPATKGALMDAGQLRTLLQANLVKGVRMRAESQVLKGDGVGDNLKGIEQYSILTQALGTDSKHDAVHKAITKIRVNEEDESDPFAIGLHPNDWERIVLEKDADGNYLNQRGAEQPSNIWGLTPVVSTLFTEGTPLVGDYRHATFWVRAGMSVAASDSHSDFFLKGLVALLAEMRAAFAVLRENAFCQVTGFNA